MSEMNKALRRLSRKRPLEIMRTAAGRKGTPERTAARMLLAMDRGKWDESKCKRDEGGRFSSTGAGGGTGVEAEAGGEDPGHEQEPGTTTGEESEAEREHSPDNNRYTESAGEALQSASNGGTILSGEPAPLERVEPKQFRETFHAAKAAVAQRWPEKAWRVDASYTEEDYADADCFVTEGGSSIAVHDGDIISVCHHPDDPIRGSDLLKAAVAKGGNKLDAYGGLYGFYIKNGFEPVSWCEWDGEYAPPDWKPEFDPEPVVFFKHTGRAYDDIVKDFGKDHHEFTRRVKASSDYGAAQKTRDENM